MWIAVIGAGYVGLVSAACFAQRGHHVVCADLDKGKIASLQEGRITIYEPGLTDVLTDPHVRRRLDFVSDSALAATDAEIVFIAVGTPARQSDGNADLTQVYAAIEDLAPALAQGSLVVTKSTVPVGTGDEIEHLMRQLRPDLQFGVASNPEFLRAGHAIDDFLKPDRVVIGAQEEKTAVLLTALYRSIGIPRQRILMTDRRSAELIKYAANGLLATKIAFINEVADLCEKVNARIDDVTTGIGLDRRIGAHFLEPGPGFGGSCFPKDARALAKMGEDHEAPMRIIEMVLASNEARKRSMVRRIAAIQEGSLRGKTIALLGLTFKAETDDLRESVSIPLAQALIDAGSLVRVYDPVAMERAKKLLPERVEYCASAFRAAKGADAIVIATEWAEFKQIDFAALRNRMKTPLVVDLRNLLDEQLLRANGFRYVGIGGARRRAYGEPSTPSLERPSRWARTGRADRETIAAAE